MAKQKENDLGMATTVSLSFAAEASLWLFIITVTLLIEFSTFSFLPAYHAAAGLMLLRVAHVVEARITEIALRLDIELMTTMFIRRVSFWGFSSLAGVSILASVGVKTG
jgi:hypothetical protein